MGLKSQAVLSRRFADAGIAASDLKHWCHERDVHVLLEDHQQDNAPTHGAHDTVKPVRHPIRYSCYVASQQSWRESDVKPQDFEGMMLQRAY